MRRATATYLSVRLIEQVVLQIDRRDVPKENYKCGTGEPLRPGSEVLICSNCCLHYALVLACNVSLAFEIDILEGSEVTNWYEGSNIYLSGALSQSGRHFESQVVHPWKAEVSCKLRFLVKRLIDNSKYLLGIPNGTVTVVNRATIDLQDASTVSEFLQPTPDASLTFTFEPAQFLDKLVELCHQPGYLWTMPIDKGLKMDIVRSLEDGKVVLGEMQNSEDTKDMEENLVNQNLVIEVQNEHAQASLVYTKQSMDEKTNSDEDRKVHCKSSGKNFANETTCSELEIEIGLKNRNIDDHEFIFDLTTNQIYNKECFPYRESLSQMGKIFPRQNSFFCYMVSVKASTPEKKESSKRTEKLEQETSDIENSNNDQETQSSVQSEEHSPSSRRPSVIKEMTKIKDMPAEDSPPNQYVMVSNYEAEEATNNWQGHFNQQTVNMDDNAQGGFNSNGNTEQIISDSPPPELLFISQGSASNLPNQLVRKARTTGSLIGGQKACRTMYEGIEQAGTLMNHLPDDSNVNSTVVVTWPLEHHQFHPVEETPVSSQINEPVGSPCSENNLIIDLNQTSPEISPAESQAVEKTSPTEMSSCNEKGPKKRALAELSKQNSREKEEAKLESQVDGPIDLSVHHTTTASSSYSARLSAGFHPPSPPSSSAIPQMMNIASNTQPDLRAFSGNLKTTSHLSSQTMHPYSFPFSSYTPSNYLSREPAQPPVQKRAYKRKSPLLIHVPTDGKRSYSRHSARKSSAPQHVTDSPVGWSSTVQRSNSRSQVHTPQQNSSPQHAALQNLILASLRDTPLAVSSTVAPARTPPVSSYPTQRNHTSQGETHSDSVPLTYPQPLQSNCLSPKQVTQPDANYYGHLYPNSQLGNGTPKRSLNAYPPPNAYPTTESHPNYQPQSHGHLGTLPNATRSSEVKTNKIPLSKPEASSTPGYHLPYAPPNPYFSSSHLYPSYVDNLSSKDLNALAAMGPFLSPQAFAAMTHLRGNQFGAYALANSQLPTPYYSSANTQRALYPSSGAYPALTGYPTRGYPAPMGPYSMHPMAQYQAALGATVQSQRASRHQPSSPALANPAQRQNSTAVSSIAPPTAWRRSNRLDSTVSASNPFDDSPSATLSRHRHHPASSGPLQSLQESYARYLTQASIPRDPTAHAFKS